MNFDLLGSLNPWRSRSFSPSSRLATPEKSPTAFRRFPPVQAGNPLVLVAGASLVAGMLTIVGSTTISQAASLPSLSNRLQPNQPVGPNLIPPQLVAQSVWQTFQPKEGGFSILMPGEPTPLGASFEVKGIPLNLRQFVSSQQNDTVVYMAGWLDLPSSELREVPVKASLDSVQEGFRARLNGEILHAFEVKLSGNPGRHYKMNAWIDNRSYSVTQRVYLKENRIYQLTAMVPRRIEFDLTRSVQGFLKSFQFVASTQAQG